MILRDLVRYCLSIPYAHSPGPTLGPLPEYSWVVSPEWRQIFVDAIKKVLDDDRAAIRGCLNPFVEARRGMSASPDAVPAAGGPHVWCPLRDEMLELNAGIDHELPDW